MSTIIVALILIISVIAICYLFIFIEKKRSRNQMNRFLKRFSELGSRYSLSFSSQEILNNSVIGLDGMRRKILILNDHDNETFSHSIIDLDEVRSCDVKKVFEVINEGGAYELYEEKQVCSVVLCFEFTLARDPVEVSFYNQLTDDPGAVEIATQKANDWETILSKMLNSPLAREWRMIERA